MVGKRWSATPSQGCEPVQYRVCGPGRQEGASAAVLTFATVRSIPTRTVDRRSVRSKTEASSSAPSFGGGMWTVCANRVLRTVPNGAPRGQ